MFIREPSAVFWTFGFPILLSLALGLAFRNKPPDAVRVAIEEGSFAEPIRAALAAGDDVRVRVLSHDDAAQALRTGKVSLVVVPKSDDTERTYRFDATRPDSRVARLLVDDKLQRAEGRKDATSFVEARVAEPGARYIDFLLPGIVGMNIMSSGMWGVGFLIVEMRTRKLIKRMIATPMKRGEFLLSFIFMRMMVLAFELPVLLTFGWLVFDVRVRGSIALLAALVTLGAVVFAGLGLLVSSRAENTQTVGGLMNLVMLPMFMCSGVFFSSANFPDAMQPAIRLLPLTALNDALRAVMNEGAGLADVGRPSLILAAWGVASFAIALKVFRWR